MIRPQQDSSHLLPLPGGSWRVWRRACLRNAGFPAHMVLSLAAPESVMAAERLFQAEDEAEQARALLDSQGSELRGRLEHTEANASLVADLG